MYVSMCRRHGQWVPSVFPFTSRKHGCTLRVSQGALCARREISDRLHCNLRVARLSAGCSKPGSPPLLKEWRTVHLSLHT